MNEPSEWAAFYTALNRLGPRLLRGLPRELQDYVEMVSADSDDFFPYGLHAEFDLWCEDRADEAARNAFQEWTHNVRSRLEEILGPDSLIPFDQMGISARKRKAWQRSLKNVRIELDDQKLRLFMDAVVLRDRAAPESPTLLVQSLLEPYREDSEGRLVHAVTVPWRVIVNTLGRDWSVAFQIAPEKWEELIAGAFDLAGYDEVTLTPRSDRPRSGCDCYQERRRVGQNYWFGESLRCSFKGSV